NWSSVIRRTVLANNYLVIEISFLVENTVESLANKSGVVVCNEHYGYTHRNVAMAGRLKSGRGRYRPGLQELTHVIRVADGQSNDARDGGDVIMPDGRSRRERQYALGKELRISKLEACVREVRSVGFHPVAPRIEVAASHHPLRPQQSLKLITCQSGFRLVDLENDILKVARFGLIVGEHTHPL